MSEVTEIEYFEDEYPGLEYVARDGCVVDQVASRAVVDTVLAMEFWTDRNFVPERVEAVEVVDAGIHDTSIIFSGSLSNSLSEDYYGEKKRGVNTRCSLRTIRGNGKAFVRVRFGEESVVGCDHEYLRYLNANTTECLKCKEEIPNSHVIREHLRNPERI